jgi:hypothetical protein
MSIKKIIYVLKNNGIFPQSDKDMLENTKGLLTVEEIRMFRAKSKLNKRELPNLLFCLGVMVILITTIPEDTFLSVVLNIVLVLNIILWLCIVGLQRLDFQKRCILACLEKLDKGGLNI